MRVKDTLNLGKTKFKMRGNLPVREAQWQKEWEENKLYEQRLKLNEGKPRFDLMMALHLLMVIFTWVTH